MKKITNDNYPVLQVIYDCVQNYNVERYVPKIGHIKDADVLGSGQTFAEVSKVFYQNCKHLFAEARNNVDYLVEHLFKRIDTDNSFRQKCLDVASDVPEDGGVVLFPQLGVCVLYSITKDDGTENKVMSVVQMYNKVVATHEVAYISSDNDVRIYTDYSFSTMPKQYKAGLLSTFVITYLIFKHFAEIEFVEIKRQVGGGKKAQATVNGQDFQTQTHFPVTVVDSSWFRTIQTDGFAVQGHWRRQWYGTQQKHRLIWIEPFEKRGYNRKAKIENL